MPEYKRITPQHLRQLLSEAPCQLADIRDEQAFRAAHIPGATHVGNHNLQDFVESADPSQPLVLYCYHGISSQSAAQYFIDRKFSEVYSVDGGFELWQHTFPDSSESH